MRGRGFYKNCSSNGHFWEKLDMGEKDISFLRRIVRNHALRAWFEEKGAISFKMHRLFWREDISDIMDIDIGHLDLDGMGRWRRRWRLR